MPHYDVEKYVLYKAKYHVAADSEAEAIWKVIDEQVKQLEGSLEFVEAAESYGLPADAYPELCQELATFDISADDVIPSIADIQEAGTHPNRTLRTPSLYVVLESEPYGRETFDHYSGLDEMLAAVKRLVESSQEQTSADGIERTVGIAVLPSRRRRRKRRCS